MTEGETYNILSFTEIGTISYGISPSVTAKPCHLPRQREALWGGVPSEVKLLRSEVAFGSEAAYGCEVASQ